MSTSWMWVCTCFQAWATSFFWFLVKMGGGHLLFSLKITFLRSTPFRWHLLFLTSASEICLQPMLSSFDSLKGSEQLELLDDVLRMSFSDLPGMYMTFPKSISSLCLRWSAPLPSLQETKHFACTSLLVHDKRAYRDFGNVRSES